MKRFVPPLVALVVLGITGAACSDVPPQLTVKPSTLVLTRPRESHQLVAEARDKEGQVLAGVSFRWRSSDPTVAEVDQSGRVTGLRSGRSMVSVDTGDVVTTVPVLVATYSSLKVDTSGLKLTVSESRAIDAHILDEKGLPIAGRIDFKSADERIAKVDEEGRVTAMGAGLTAILVTAQELLAAVPVSVTAMVVNEPVPGPTAPPAVTP